MIAIETQKYLGLEFVISYDEDCTYFATTTYNGIEFVGSSGQPDYAIDDCLKNVWQRFPPKESTEEDIPF